MKIVSFAEFLKHASGLLQDVENGEHLLVVRHGMPVAEIKPVSDAQGRTPSWKRPGLKLSVKGASLAAAILEERARAGIP